MSPFPQGPKVNWWAWIIVMPFQLALVIITLPIALAAVLLVLVLLPVFLLCFFLWDRIVGVKSDEDDGSEPPSFWPSSVQTVSSEHFGELHVARNGQPWLKTTMPAFARFGARYEEFAGWVYPDLPPPGEIAFLLGPEGESLSQIDTPERRQLFDLIGQHQESIADAIADQVPDAAWLEEDEASNVVDRFRISRARLERRESASGGITLVTLDVDQTWDEEHGWSVEIEGLSDQGFESLEFGIM